MTEISVRDRVLRAVEDMPGDTTFEDVMERVYMLQKIERGRRQTAEGNGVPREAAKHNMKRWHEYLVPTSCDTARERFAKGRTAACPERISLA